MRIPASRLVMPLLIGALVLTMMVAMACNQSEYRKLVQAHAAAASALGSVATITSDLFDAREISVEAAVAIEEEVEYAIRLNAAFGDRLSQVKSISPADHALAQRWLSDLTGSVMALERGGDLYIKNPESRAKFAAAIAAAKSAISIAGAVVTASEVNSGSSSGDDFSAARAGRDDLDRAAGRRDQGAVRNDGRATARLGKREGRANASADRKVLGCASDADCILIACGDDGCFASDADGVLASDIGSAERQRCARASSVEWEWRTGRCHLRA